MSLTPQTLVSDALSAGSPYVHPRSVSRMALLNALTSLEAEVVALYAHNAPWRLSALGTSIPVVVASNAAGYALTAGYAYSGFTYTDSSGNVFIIYTELNERNFDDPPKNPAGLLRGNTFFPADPLSRRWATTDSREWYIGDGDSIQYRYIAEPARVTSLTQTLVSPDEARPYLQASLNLLVLSSGVGVPQPILNEANVARTRAWQALALNASKRGV